jgi:type IV secretion system protein VirB11
MNSAVSEHQPVNRNASVNFLLKPIRQWMQDPEITEICINRPGEVFIEAKSVWTRHEVPDLTLDLLGSLATAIARFAANDIQDTRPLLSAVMPGGERIQIVRAPACEHGTFSVTIRKPSHAIRLMSEYEDQGFFSHLQPITCTPAERIGLNAIDTELLGQFDAGKYVEFLRNAVLREKVIVVAGETGSGKTTFMKSLMQEIPKGERIITIEDVPELFLPNHPNHVHLFYPSESKGAEGAIVTPTTLLKSCMRMKPSRILLAELRGGETYDFVNVCASGHGGSITSCHAGSAELTFVRLAQLVLQSEEGQCLPYSVIQELLYLVIDVVIHVHNDSINGKGRHVTEMWFNPMMKRQKAGADKSAQMMQAVMQMQQRIGELEGRLSTLLPR